MDGWVGTGTHTLSLAVRSLYYTAGRHIMDGSDFGGTRVKYFIDYILLLYL